MFRDIVDTTYDYQTDINRWQNALDFNRDLILGNVQVDVQQRLEKNLQTALNFPDYLIERFVSTVRENFPNLDTSEPS
jgi:hypothetical protein